jgi:adenylosuccinate synthase
MNYRFNNEIIDYIPFEDNKVEPVYKSVKGWNCEIDKVKKEEDFPSELNDYIRLIESETGVKISVVSLGPDRLQTIFR